MLDGDIVCLQEVDPPYFAGILREDMSLLGYDGLLAQKSRFKEGVALFFKKNKFDLQESKALVLDEIATDVFKVAESDKFGEALILAALRHDDSNTMVLTGTYKIVLINLQSIFIQRDSVFLLGGRGGGLLKGSVYGKVLTEVSACWLTVQEPIMGS